MGQKESSISDDSVNSESESDLQTDSNNTNTIPREWYDDQLLKRCKNVYFDVETWYKIIQSETFYTEFIPISPSLAQAFINFYQTRYTSNKLLNSNDIQLITSIQNQLKEQIFNSKTNQFQNNETFIRLSSRSPKDGMPLDSRKISQFYHQKLNELQIKYANDCLLQIKTTIIKYWKETIQPLLDPFTEKYSNYVIDIELIENKLTNKYDCIVIKMNPFETTTNPSLFDWTKDYNQLRGQGYQIEIRVRSDYYPDIEDYIQFLLQVNQCNPM